MNSIVLSLTLLAVGLCVVPALGGGFEGGPGGFSDGDYSNEDYSDCRCSRGFSRSSGTCYNNQGLKSVSCGNVNVYKQCNDSACSIATCPAGQIFNSTTLSCVPCPAGFQISANNRVCVCAQGTTRTGFSTCGPCPTNSNITQYACPCNAGTVLNRQANACQACPANAVLRGKYCACNDTLIFNPVSWSCVPCPGTSVPDSSQDSAENSCECPIRGQIIDFTTNTCTCPPGSAVNAAGTRCTRIAATTTAPAGAP